MTPTSPPASCIPRAHALRRRTASSDGLAVRFSTGLRARSPRTRRRTRVMSFGIIDTIQQVFSSDVVNQVASSTGETPPKARSALSAGAFAALAGLIDRGATREGAQGLLASLKRPSQGVGILGDKSEELVSTVASSSGTSQATAQQVLGSITPIAAGILSKHVMAKGLD